MSNYRQSRVIDSDGCFLIWAYCVSSSGQHDSGNSHWIVTHSPQGNVEHWEQCEGHSRRFKVAASAAVGDVVEFGCYAYSLKNPLMICFGLISKLSQEEIEIVPLGSANPYKGHLVWNESTIRQGEYLGPKNGGVTMRCEGVEIDIDLSAGTFEVAK